MCSDTCAPRVCSMSTEVPPHSCGALGQAFLEALLELEVSLRIPPEVAQTMRQTFDSAVDAVVRKLAHERHGVEANIHGRVDWSMVVCTEVQIHLLECDVHLPFLRAPIETAENMSLYLQDVPKYTQPSL